MCACTAGVNNPAPRMRRKGQVIALCLDSSYRVSAKKIFFLKLTFRCPFQHRKASKWPPIQLSSSRSPNGPCEVWVYVIDTCACMCLHAFLAACASSHINVWGTCASWSSSYVIISYLGFYFHVLVIPKNGRLHHSYSSDPRSTWKARSLCTY